MEISVEIPTIGRFQAERSESDGTIYCYAARIPFKNSKPDLIVYPNEDGSPLSKSQKEELGNRFRQFESSIDTALMDLPRQLRRVCRLYDIDTTGLSDDGLRRDLNWHNIKLDDDGMIECYTDNKKVSKDLDIVLRFSPDMRLVEVHFDG